MLLSHDHYDHLCHSTVRARAWTAVPFITSLGVGAHFETFGVPPERITELESWQSHWLSMGQLWGPRGHKMVRRNVPDGREHGSSPADRLMAANPVPPTDCVCALFPGSYQRSATGRTRRC